MSIVMLLLSLSKLINLMECLKKCYQFGTNFSLQKKKKKESVQSLFFFRKIPSIVMNHGWRSVNIEKEENNLKIKCSHGKC